ncbi:DUF6338 family protein [Massilia pinisoli]|uniref:DUF6338 family protein n=1 Tax=Massilia pinisoli TaxID=1772194 RepID=A0ABT2A0B2_9BURK|nr:DUF6338 family protein [Massilia pinisoli]MCS0585554.1 DUF6338 family protein [Massilia pinisoli]
MPEVSKDLIVLLQYLLPGFLVAWICFGVTSHQKPSQFERVVQALIYSLFVHFVVSAERLAAIKIGRWRVLGLWDSESDLFASLVTAIILGTVFSYLINSDRLHRNLRKFGISTRSSHPSEWCTAFDTKKYWIVVHLKDDRRIYGWPHIWPSDPTKGHIMIVHASWLANEPGSENNTTDENSTSQQDMQILIDVVDIKWVEFVVNPEETNGIETTTNTNTTSSNDALQRAA